MATAWRASRTWRPQFQNEPACTRRQPPHNRVMLTCCNRYQIDPAQAERFAEYARRWVMLTNRHGGTHHGFFTGVELAEHPVLSYPGFGAEAGADIAYAWYSFPDEAAYHAFRASVKTDPDCAEAEALGRDGCILGYERSFLGKVA
jgi:hypothetical protein